MIPSTSHGGQKYQFRPPHLNVAGKHLSSLQEEQGDDKLNQTLDLETNEVQSKLEGNAIDLRVTEDEDGLSDY